MLSEKDDSLAQAARNAPAPKIEKRRSPNSGNARSSTTTVKKRRSSTMSSGSGAGGKSGGKKRRSSNGGDGGVDGDDDTTAISTSPSGTNKQRKSAELVDREARGMESLVTFIADQDGGDQGMVKKYRCRVTVKPSDGRFDVNFFNEHGKRFRSMLEVGRFLNLVNDKQGPSTSRSAAATAGIGNLKKKRKRGSGLSTTSATSARQIEAEKKKLRKELDRLRKQYGRATKSLDNFLEDDKDSQYPVEDSFLQEEEEAAEAAAEEKVKEESAIQDPSIVSTLCSVVHPTNCPAARIPDIDTFQGLPKYCMAEALQSWDFLCTFSRAINVLPLPLNDFLQCLNYVPPSKSVDSDAYNAPPVYLGEIHLGLLKLILGDPSSDEWWWSILETEHTENAVLAHKGPKEDVIEKEEESDLPLIRINFAALLADQEDPLMTNSWLQALDPIRSMKSSDAAAMKNTLNEGTKLVANKWVLAFFRKAIKLGKTSGPSFMKQAVVWLLDKVTEAKPELAKNTKVSEILKRRAKVVEEVEQKMEKLSSATLAVNEEDLASDAEEEDDDDEEEDSDDESQVENHDLHKHVKKNHSENGSDGDQPASYIPKKPSPTLVDFLLPPGKPAPQSEVLNPSSWPYLAAAAACRVVHRYKRLRNEVDDGLRKSRELPQLTIKERREREAMSSARVFSEFITQDGVNESVEHALELLCAGGNYLELTPFERLSVLRVLIEAAYDTNKVNEVVSSNHIQRTNAVKALDVEQRRAKREAKEKAATDDAIARKDLALEAKHNFIEEKREEIRKLNQNNQELTAEDIDTLTEQDILDFDEDIKADFEALPTAESFKKTEVVARIAKIQEASAFETELLTVLTMEEILERESNMITAMEEDLKELGGEDALMDPSLERNDARKIEKLRRDIRKTQESTQYLPDVRTEAVVQLKEAMHDGTIKSLRSAIRAAKTAKLFGPDYDTNGIWSLDVVRDVHMELENAKQMKRVADAQKDLVSKLNKCFIRTEPIGYDRFRNRFWRFENSDQSHVWTEVNLVMKNSASKLSNNPGFLEVVSDVSNIYIGPSDIEEDFPPDDAIVSKIDFQPFSRQEYHQSGVKASLARQKWGCHLNELSVRLLMKGLDSRGIRENHLKKSLKEALEEKTTSAEGGAENKDQPEGGEIGKVEDKEDKESERNEKFDPMGAESTDQPVGGEAGKVEDKEVKEYEFDPMSGDETVYEDVKKSAVASHSDSSSIETIKSLKSSAIGQEVRIRIVLESNKDGGVARYEVATIISWKKRKDKVPIDPDENEFDPQLKTIETPLWRARTANGTEAWLLGPDLIESIIRFLKWKRKDANYFEHDAAFLTYRNNLGRHLGKAADAPHVMTPIRFGQYMVKREAELYQRLKVLAYDNNWGGKSGSRNAWITSMRDYAFDLQTAREGMLTLESAFFELIGGEIKQDANDNSTTMTGKELLNNPKTREDIELESIDTNVSGLWSSQASRNVFIEIVSSKS